MGVFGVHVKDCVAKHADRGNRVYTLPEQVAWIEVASHVAAGDRAQPQHRLGAVDNESRMHFDGDLYSVVRGEFCMLDPVGCDDFIPLPVKHFAEIRRPRARDPVRCGGVWRISRATGKIHCHGDSQLFGQKDGLTACLTMRLGDGLVRVQPIAVAAQSADGEAVIAQNLLELRQCRRVFQHRELAMRIADVVSRPQFDGTDVEFVELIENRFQGKF